MLFLDLVLVLVLVFVLFFFLLSSYSSKNHSFVDDWTIQSLMGLGEGGRGLSIRDDAFEAPLTPRQPVVGIVVIDGGALAVTAPDTKFPAYDVGGS